MLNLLNAVDIFGKQLGWNSSASLGVFITLAVVLAIIAIVMIIYLTRLRKKRATATDTTETVVTVAEPAPSKTDVVFIQAEPVKTEPTTVIVEKPVIVEKVVEVEKPVEVEKIVEVEKPVVVEKVVEKPVVIQQVVTKPVPTEKKTSKTVVVEKVVEKPVIVERIVEKPVVQTIVIEEESAEAGRLRYDKSFEARLIQSDDEVKHWYTEIKNELLSYKTCKGRLSWKRETFKAQKEVVAKLVFRGNTLCLFVPLRVKDYENSKDVEIIDLPTYDDTPVMVRLKNEKRVKLAMELISKVMMERSILRGAHVSEDFYVPYEGLVELINRGLIKREIRDVAEEAIFDAPKKDEE